MKTSESIKQLAAAINRAQKKIGAAVKGNSNPFFKSKYADLGAVMEACKEHLNAEGITVLQPVHSDETGDYVETVLLHDSGEFMSSRMRMLPSKNMQELGSATSYARRYGLQSMVFIPAEDDDGNHSTFGKAAPEKTAPKPAAKQEVKAEPATAALAAFAAATPASPSAQEAPKRSSFRKPAAPAAAQPVTSDDGWE